jgi:hypothetical protein
MLKMNGRPVIAIAVWQAKKYLRRKSEAGINRGEDNEALSGLLLLLSSHLVFYRRLLRQPQERFTVTQPAIG